ncbi:hypothetical protein BD289DRAFT_485222 [Coniella lustricola]|uniref:Uncharacterized protein n=1 Tax=Coniella lustricola TaxID=2025994 RepID=A0A2T2ZZI2_9PEZI|nr:hypothetical protein BD289DRAFT_485222 [Coniella lustricola]
MASSPTQTPAQPAKGAPQLDFMSDEQLEKDWKPNARRPQSTIARSFSAELEGIFRIDNSVAELDAKLDERKHTVQTQASELEALEQRIREMEERLKRNAINPAPQTTIPERRPIAHQPSNSTLTATNTEQQKHGGSRPGTAKASQQAVPGALPPTPTASEGEYEFVPDPFTTSFGPEYPRYRHQLLLPRMMNSPAIPSIGVSGMLGPGAAASAALLQNQAQQLRSQHYHHHHPHPPPPPQPSQSQQQQPQYNQHLIHNTPSAPSAADARSVKSVRTIGSESGSADFVIVPGPDGDGEQDHH